MSNEEAVMNRAADRAVHDAIYVADQAAVMLDPVQARLMWSRIAQIAQDRLAVARAESRPRMRFGEEHRAEDASQAVP